MIDSNIIISFICSTIGIIFGFIIRKYFERRMNYDIKHDELVLNNEIENLKDKLDIYWSIYFKLLICQSANMQIKKLNNVKHIETDIIIKNLDEIIVIISNNIQKMNIDDKLLDLIVQFITHVLAYKLPSKKNYSFPDRFTDEITKRTFKYQLLFNKYIKNNEPEKLNIDLEFKEKIKKIHEQISNNPINQVQIDDEDLDIDCDIDDIDLEAVFDNSKKNLIIHINV